MQNIHKELILKSIIWRIFGIGILALITYCATRSWIITSLITLSHHVIFILIYFLHEIFWIKIGSKISEKKRIILKPFLYEVVLGHCVLGVISLIFTGNWTQVTWITIPYIENKIWIYIIYDYIWNKLI